MKSFTQSAIANFVAKFLSDNGSEELVEKWNTQENIEAFNNVTVKTKRSSDKIKDPNKPKRGKSAYIFFCAKKRDEAKANLGEGAKATEVTSELGLMWNALKASTKSADKKFLASLVSEAAEDKARYTEEMESYVAPSDEDLATMVSPKKGRKTSDKDPNAPKKGKSAYIFFCADMRPQVKEELGEEGKSLIMSELGKRWKELKEDENRAAELDRYAKMAADDKARYEEEKKDHPTEQAHKEDDESDEEEKPAPKKAKAKKAKPKKDDEESDEEKPAPKKAKPKKEKPKKDDKESDEEKPTPKKAKPKKNDAEEKESPKKKTGYAYFCSVNREGVKTDNPDMKAQDVTRELARLWKELDKDEQTEWSSSAAKL
jgi:hypothetical protein